MCSLSSITIFGEDQAYLLNYLVFRDSRVDLAVLLHHKVGYLATWSNSPMASASLKELFCYFHIGGHFVTNAEGKTHYVGGRSNVHSVKSPSDTIF
ncbi:hypothetical protein K1719_000945 [Acacia pycnantha]|nr:hypothetical protein K1719_000945 [Acacia pycnantha]